MAPEAAGGDGPPRPAPAAGGVHDTAPYRGARLVFANRHGLLTCSFINLLPRGCQPAATTYRVQLSGEHACCDDEVETEALRFLACDRDGGGRVVRKLRNVAVPTVIQVALAPSSAQLSNTP